MAQHEVKAREKEVWLYNSRPLVFCAWSCHAKKNKTQAWPSDIYLQGIEQCSHKNPSLQETHDVEAQLGSHHLQLLEKYVSQLRTFIFKIFWGVAKPL